MIYEFIEMAENDVAAIAFRYKYLIIPKHKEEATDDIREKGERG
jgi:hypothetical protein